MRVQMKHLLPRTSALVELYPVPRTRNSRSLRDLTDSHQYPTEHIHMRISGLVEAVEARFGDY